MGEVIAFKPRLTPRAQTAIDLLKRAAAGSVTCEHSELVDRKSAVSSSFSLFGGSLPFSTKTQGGLPVSAQRLTTLARRTAHLLADQLASKGRVDTSHFDRLASQSGRELQHVGSCRNRSATDQDRMDALTRACEALHTRELARALAAVAMMQAEIAEQSELVRA